MIRFNNDYNHGAHPEILEVLRAVNDNSFGGYGEDEWCKKAADLIRERVHCPDAAIHFFPGATQANFIVIASALSSVQSVIAADTGHINCHEALPACACVAVAEGLSRFPAVRSPRPEPRPEP